MSVSVLRTPAMGARWRMAIAAQILIALVALAAVAADSESGSVMEAVHLRFDDGRSQPINNNHLPDLGRFQTIREEEEMDTPPRLSELSRDELDTMDSSEQQALLRKLAAEKRRLRSMLNRRPAHKDASDWETRPVRRQHRYVPSQTFRKRGYPLLTEDPAHSSFRPSRGDSDEDSDDEETDALVEHSSAMFRAAMKAEVLQRAKDRKRQAAIERDEEELEEEQAESFRAKLHEKDQKHKAQKARLLHQLERYKRRDRMDKQMLKEAKETAANSAAQVARDAAAHMAGEMEQELMRDVRHTLPQQLAQQGLHTPRAVQHPDLVRLQDRTVQTTGEHSADAAAQQDPEVKRLRRQIAQLQQTLKSASDQPKESTASDQQAAPAEPAEPVASTSAAPLIMETDSTSTQKARIAPEPKKARVTPEQPKKAPPVLAPKSARVVAQPPQPVTAAPKASPEPPSVVDVVPEKAPQEPLEVDTPSTPSAEPIIEGGENEEEAEYNLIAYATWGSVGALVVGLFSTVVYCACQQPRDRPWGMPPKRQF